MVSSQNLLGFVTKVLLNASRSARCRSLSRSLTAGVWQCKLDSAKRLRMVLRDTSRASAWRVFEALVRGWSLTYCTMAASCAGNVHLGCPLRGLSRKLIPNNQYADIMSFIISNIINYDHHSRSLTGIVPLTPSSDSRPSHPKLPCYFRPRHPMLV